VRAGVAVDVASIAVTWATTAVAAVGTSGPTGVTCGVGATGNGVMEGRTTRRGVALGVGVIAPDVAVGGGVGVSVAGTTGSTTTYDAKRAMTSSPCSVMLRQPIK
jgi:hypothetical protein